MPRHRLAELSPASRDALAILATQDAGRLQDLVPLRAERMRQSPFAFYRGTAAIMATDLGTGESSGIAVASCGDAHVSNFGFYASPQRTLVFDLNDFDEAAWAPWEWDLKRLVTSIVIAGVASGRSSSVIDDAARGAVMAYAETLRRGLTLSPLQRYYHHFDAAGGLRGADKATRRVLKDAIAHAHRRTGEQATRKLTRLDADGILRFIDEPPTMTHADPAALARADAALSDYIRTTRVDIQLVLAHYAAADTVRRVVGVGSVGTRCYVTLLVDGAGKTLLLQTKEAGRSVLVEHGGWEQPAEIAHLIEQVGDGGRVVALQQILQGVSDPFLGHFRSGERDFYVRQFRDMKGGIEVETLDDAPYRSYAVACATVLARAHGQSPAAAQVVGYLGGGRVAAEAITAWAYAYAERSRADYDAFVASHPAR